MYKTFKASSICSKIICGYISFVGKMFVVVYKPQKPRESVLLPSSYDPHIWKILDQQIVLL